MTGNKQSEYNWCDDTLRVQESTAVLQVILLITNFLSFFI